jgi:hypothetical protein
MNWLHHPDLPFIAAAVVFTAIELAAVTGWLRFLF